MTLPFDCPHIGVTLNGIFLVAAVCACSSTLELEITKPPTQGLHS